MVPQLEQAGCSIFTMVRMILRRSNYLHTRVSLYFVQRVAINSGGYSLWRTDGTANGTIELTTEPIRNPLLHRASHLNSDLILYAEQDEGWLWRTDGTVEGTQKFMVSLGPTQFVEFNGLFYFFSTGVGETGGGLYRTDGTDNSTELIHLMSGRDLTVHNGRLFFSGTIASQGSGLWRRDGTSDRSELIVSSDTIRFTHTPLGFIYASSEESSPNCPLLWLTDGTKAGTQQITAPCPEATSIPYNFVTFHVVGRHLLFTGEQVVTGKELWAVTFAPPLATIVLEKRTEPSGETQSFPFSGDFIGTLIDRQPLTITDVVSGSYTITEAEIDGFTLTDIRCDDNKSVVNVAARTITLNVQLGDVVTCVSTSNKDVVFVEELALDLTIDAPPVAAVGETVMMTLHITNGGNITLTELTLSNDRLGQIMLNPPHLSASAAISRTELYTVVESDMPGPLDINIMANGISPEGQRTTIAKEVAIQLGDSVAIGGGREARLSYDSDRVVLDIPSSAQAAFLFNQMAVPNNLPGTFRFAGSAFSIRAVKDGQTIEDYLFAQPARMTIRYSDEEILDLDEATVGLHYFDAKMNQWRTDGVEVIEHNTSENYIVLNITHLTDFALLGTSKPERNQKALYLPIISNPTAQ